MDGWMVRFDEGILRAARKAAAILVFVALVTNQWRYLFELHATSITGYWEARETKERERTFSLQDDCNRQGFNLIKASEHQHQQLHRGSPGVTVVNEIIHRGFFGLGHRLHRSAASYHLTRSLSSPRTLQSAAGDTDPASVHQSQEQPTITHLRFHWESCLANDDQGNATVFDGKEEEKEYNVFRYLFRDDIWELSDPSENDLFPSRCSSNGDNDYNYNAGNFQNRRNMIVVRNDVPGYIAGQVYKDLKLPVKMNPKGSSSQSIGTKQSSSTTSDSSNQIYEYEHILDKVMNSDVHFYRRLVKKYRFQSEIEDFQSQHKWSQRPLVIGLHLRVGNGEDAHFVQSGRAAANNKDETVMISRLVELINEVATHEIERRREQNKDQRWERQRRHDESNLSPLLFVATDTAHLIPLVEEAVKLAVYDDGRSRFASNESQSQETHTNGRLSVPLEIITWPQYRLPRNSGVGFDTLQGKGDRCLEGWKSAMSDALMLSQVDLLIAAKRSTFTQSLPLTLGFDRNRESDEINQSGDAELTPEGATSAKRSFLFCEVSESDTARISCFANMREWLFRGEDDQNVMFGAHKRKEEHAKSPKLNPGILTFVIDEVASQASSSREQTNQQVEHRLTVLLPDVVPPDEFEEARAFLRRENAYDPETSATDGQTREAVFRYGLSKINKKYRNANKEGQAMPSPTSKGRWNIVLNR